jgi:SanA protein
MSPQFFFGTAIIKITNLWASKFVNKTEKQAGFLNAFRTTPVQSSQAIKKIILKRVKNSVCIAFSGLLLLLLIPNWIIIRKTQRQIYHSPAEISNSEVGIILGAAVFKERVSPVLKDRIVTTVDLYKRGKIKKILVSGDHGQKYYDEVNAIMHWLQKYEIPRSDIITDPSGFSTSESILRAQKIYHVRNAIVITQEFHLPRALYIAANSGMSATGLCADRRRYKNIQWYTVREYLARVKDFFKVRLINF